MLSYLIILFITRNVFSENNDAVKSSTEKENVEKLQINSTCPEFVISETVRYVNELKYHVPDEQKVALTGHYNGIRPQHYNLKMNFLDSKQFKFVSNVVVHFEVVESADRLILDINPNSVNFMDKSKVIITESSTGKTICLKSVAMVTEDRVMVAELSDKLIAGKGYVLDLGSFSGSPLKGNKGSWGIQVGGNRGTIWALTSIFQMRGARTVFPCFDHPSLKATFNVCIEHSSDTVADSSANLAKSKKLGNGRILDYFEPTLKIPIYILSIALMKQFSKITSHGDYRIDLYHLSIVNGSKFDWEIPLTRNIIKRMEEKTHVKYVLKKFGLLNVRNAPFWGIENFGLVTLEDRFTKNAETDLGRRLVVHEIIHQWAGNMVTCSDWSQICLQEGLTTFLEWTISYEFNCTKKSRDALAKQTIIDYLEVKNQTVPLIHYYNVTKEIAEYCFQKPPVIMHMVAHFFGEEIWYEILKELLKNKKFGNANLTDWKIALDSVSGSKNVGEILESWYTAVGYPIFYAYSKPDNFIIIKQYSDSWNDEKPHLANNAIVTPIRILTQNGVGPGKGPLIIKEPKTTFQINGASKWFIIDPDVVTLSRKIYTMDNYLALIQCFSEKSSSYCTHVVLTNVFHDFCFALTNDYLAWDMAIDGARSGVTEINPQMWVRLFSALYNTSTDKANNQKSELINLSEICRLCITDYKIVQREGGEIFSSWNANCKQLKMLPHEP